MNSRLCLLLFLALNISLPAQPQRGGKAKELRQEEKRDYYRKWLEEDVPYIITEEERRVFESLTTDEEKERFIEQFWRRRDPDPATAVNEYKEEHYRRIAYANEHFYSGMPGWMTDRGRIYIIHGPPAEIDSHPSGGTYMRPPEEGGGSTTTYPFEVWRYRYIEGVGSDVEIEFVDPTSSGEYRLALDREEKDALLHIPGAGLTRAEQLGLARKADRPYFSPGNTRYPLLNRTSRDDPFERYARYAGVQRPEPIHYRDLKEIVHLAVKYSALPLRIRQDHFRLNEGKVLVPVTLELSNRDLTFVEAQGRHTAKVAVYGVVTSLGGRVVEEFEHDLSTSYRDQDFARGRLGASVYQKMLALERRTRYKLNLVVKDLNSGEVGVLQRAIIPPPAKGGLALSSLLISDVVEVVEPSSWNRMFVLGDVRVRPRLDGTFPPGRPLRAYLQVYGATFDQSSREPLLKVSYAIVQEGRELGSLVDRQGKSIHYAAPQRVILIQSLKTGRLRAGKYLLRVEVEDLATGERVVASRPFRLSQAGGNSP